MGVSLLRLIEQIFKGVVCYVYQGSRKFQELWAYYKKNWAR